MNIKNILNKIYILAIAFICFFGVMIFFISSSNIANSIGEHLYVLPSFNGGEIAADVYDTAGDDFGNGNLVYPSNSQFTEGAFDLVHYTVHEPVAKAKWQPNSEYWQLVLEYKNGSPRVRNIMIYIDLDNFEWASDSFTSENRGLSPLYDAAENVTFDIKHPWDFAVQIADGKGKVFTPDADLICNTEYYELDGGKTIKIRIPLYNEYLQNVYASQKTFHYVVTGGYSQFDRGNFMPIEKRRSLSRGGTKSAKEYNALIPKIYDVLGENTQLGTWNANDFTKALLIPVEIEMHPYSGNGTKKSAKRNSAKEDEAFIKKVSQEYSKYVSSNSTVLENPENAKEELRAKLEKNPDDCLTMAYYGSCLALLGGQSSVLQAVALVNESFEYLDKAAELSRNTPEEKEVLLNRANVCLAVPNDVFNKAETGANDFMRIISIYQNSMSEEELAAPQNKYAVAYCYAMASMCYKALGKQTDSVLALQEAKKLIQ